MFLRWGPLVVRARWWVLAGAVGLLVTGAGWGTGVFGVLTGGGFEDPGSESTVAHQRILAEVGNQDVHLLVLFSSPDATVDDPQFAAAVTGTVAALRGSPAVVQAVSWYDSPEPTPELARLVSQDRRATYVPVRLVGDDDEDVLLDSYHQVEPLLAAPGVGVEVGGLVAFYDQALEQTERDIIRAEVISFPVLLILLVLIFRGLVAAVSPLVIGALAILGAFATTRLLALATDISIFAINFITVIGLGMAIDYALLVVNRFREELAVGHPPATAITRTLATAGRSVLVSAATTILALASLLVFPLPFLRSMALGGIAAIGIAMLGALTVLPAGLAVLGHRVNAGRISLPRLSKQDTWARIARSVMRRPVPYLLGVVLLLLVVASPAVRVTFGGFDERELPPGAQARVVAERIATEFGEACESDQDLCGAGSQNDPIQVLVSGADPGTAEALVGQVAALPEVGAAEVTAQRGTSWVVSVSYPGEPTGQAAREAVQAVRDVPAPAGTDVLLSGRTAALVDLVASLRAGLPWMLLLMASAIMLVLFLAFGSVVLPVKAVLANLLSIGAAVGVVVWGFQDGHLSGLLGFTVTGFVDPAVLVLLIAVLFGISTDYEVFLLSRVREQWDATGDNQASVAHGLQRTGRIITAAALLLIVVVGGFAAGEMTFVKLLGVGMIVAIAVDATLIRALLVPATMRLLGRGNWWPASRPKFGELAG